ncbi:MAG: hypothetical protein LBP65_01645 [Puniceicoccales bacterium]|jgi:hypothetical protein|nr:hypothetical protein [Puniceicoccales bacterium]
MGRLALALLLANGALAIPFFCSKTKNFSKNRPSTAVVEKIFFDGAEVLRRGEGWWFTKPLHWPAAGQLIDLAIGRSGRGGPSLALEDGPWLDFLEKRLLWYDPNLLDRIQLRRGSTTLLLERRAGTWQLLPDGELDSQQLVRWLELLRSLAIKNLAGEWAGAPVATLLLEGPLAAQRQRLEFFVGQDGAGLVVVNGDAAFVLAGDCWKEVVDGVNFLRSRRLFAKNPGRIFWENGDEVVVWERGGEKWMRIRCRGAVEEMENVAVARLQNALLQLEWEREWDGEVGGVVCTLSVDGHRLALGRPLGRWVVAVDGQRRRAFLLKIDAVERIRSLLLDDADGNLAAARPDENGGN